jgi:hypothetical protein
VSSNPQPFPYPPYHQHPENPSGLDEHDMIQSALSQPGSIPNRWVRYLR